MTFTDSLWTEISYRFGLMLETALEEKEPAPLLDDETLYQIFHDMENSDAGLGPWKREIQDWWILKGVYKAVTKADLAAIQVSRGRKYDFRRGDTYYIFERGL